MKGVKRILACVDLSDYSKLTMEFAIELSTSFQTELVILNVINTRDVYAVESYSHSSPEKFNLDNFLKKHYSN